MPQRAISKYRNHMLAAANFLGTWQGHANLIKQGSCFLNLEIRRKPGEKFSGFPALICMPDNGPPVPAAVALARLNPETAILSGELQQDGSIAFKVEKLTSTSESGCGMTGFTLTFFGEQKLAAQWTDSCGGSAQMLLVKSR
jgi:hypothetical protein